MTERQVGERLSEQIDFEEAGRVARRVTFGYADCGTPVDLEELTNLAHAYQSLARQLAEAERHPLGCEACMVEIRKAVARGVTYLDNSMLCEGGRALHAPDPPASPAEGSEDAHARAEHLREAREVEDHQEAKHGDV